MTPKACKQSEALRIPEELKRLFLELDSVVVAFSGGVDSALVLRLAVAVLGPRRVVAAVADSASLPERDRSLVQAYADRLGVPLHMLATRELEDPRYAANPVDRCFFCKDELYSRFSALAAELGFAAVVDGTNADDVKAHRPGMAAAKKAGVRSPLLDAGLDKTAVRALARALDVPMWNKPASACLASRIPYNTRVSAEVLRQIDRAEQILLDNGFATVRVRHHGEIARIEVTPEMVPRLLHPDMRQRISTALKEVGYRYVTVDLDGYRSGSLNPPAQQEARR